MTETPAGAYSRRSFLIGAAAMVATACSGSDEEDADAEPTSTTTLSDITTSAVAADEASEADEAAEAAEASGSDPEQLVDTMFAALPICALVPEAAEGPFPNLELLDRRDVTEGYPGHPLRLGIRVVDIDCRPVPGAQVEIWHADATGDYSSYTDDGSGKDEGEGTTFLRGVQTADDNGILEFQTIYPGWYEGRAVHIHATARVGDRDVLTTQLYFDEAYTEAVFQSGEYATFGPPDTGWADDFLIGDPAANGSGIVLAAAPTSVGPGTLGLLNLGVPV